MANILIVEDEIAINDLIALHLKLANYRCNQVFDGDAALKAFKCEKYDLVLLDVMIPEIDGFSLMETLSDKNIPVIFVTAKDNILDKVKAFKLGAIDYLVKPFDIVELLLRVESVLRRIHPEHNLFIIKNLTVNFDERIVKVGNQFVNLTNREFQLLEALINNRNIALSREQLLNIVWGYDYFGDIRTVDVHITKLRQKLSLESHIKTVYKLGYRLEV